jgi:putative pyruvate formate lyase activating enzyme
LHVPLVYNCGGFESVSTLKQLRGIFDIYMPDIKYSDNAIALRYSQASSYWDVVRPATVEMFEQVGDLQCIDGAAKKGLLIRHLVLPQGLAGSREVFTFIKEHLSADTYVNIMDQYYPCFKAFEYKELSRKILPAEYQTAAGAAQEAGLKCVHVTRSLV